MQMQMQQTQTKTQTKNGNYEIIRIEAKDLKTNNAGDIIFNYPTKAETDTIQDKAEYKAKFLQRKNLKIKARNSELTRILLTLQPERYFDYSEYLFLDDLICLKIGNNTSKYEDIKANNGIIIVNGERFKRCICASGHNRQQKAYFVKETEFDDIMNVALCGINPSLEYTASKINAYIGLMSSDSTPISPDTKINFVVIPDCYNEINEKFTVVTRRTIKDKNKFKDVYNVTDDVQRAEKINAFDGAGIISPEMAKEFSEQLGLDYVASDFQFRCIPAIKGELFTFDFKALAKEKGLTEVKDLWGKVHNINDVDVILTESQFKFHKFFKSYDEWEQAFLQPLTLSNGAKYQRTFNISRYGLQAEDIPREKFISYQALQTLQLTDNDVQTLCENTAKNINDMQSDPDKFLEYKGYKEMNRKLVPPYYKALQNNKYLINDDYLADKIKSDLKAVKLQSCFNRFAVQQTFQTVCPDLYALTEWALGLQPSGILKKGEIYSAITENEKVTLLRYPHIAQEFSDDITVQKNVQLQKWFKYQTATVVLNVWDSTPLKLGTMDFDGDEIYIISDKTICRAAKEQHENTILFDDLESSKGINSKFNDVAGLMQSDLNGFGNNIGAVSNKVTFLWQKLSTLEKGSIEYETCREFIIILSVVNQLTIDFVKTGVKVSIPSMVNAYLKEEITNTDKKVIKKPYFWHYKSNKDLQEFNKNMKLFADYSLNQNDDLNYNDVQFGECDNSTCNKICKYFEENIQLERKRNTKYFVWANYRPYKTDYRKNSNKTYARIAEVLQSLTAEYNALSKAMGDMDYTASDDERTDAFDTFFSYCRYTLLNEFKRGSSDTKMVTLTDYMIYYYYYDNTITGKNKALLWNIFPEQIMKLVSNKEIKGVVTQETKKMQKSIDYNKKRIASKKNNYQKINCYELKNVSQELQFLKAMEFNSQLIIKEINNHEISDDSKRLLATLVILAKLTTNINYIYLYIKGKGRINERTLMYISGLDTDHYKKAIQELCDTKLIDIKKDAEANRIIISIVNEYKITAADNDITFNIYKDSKDEYRWNNEDVQELPHIIDSLFRKNVKYSA